MNSTLVRLGDVIDYQTGFPFKSKHYAEGKEGIKLLRGDNISQGALRWESAKHWPEPLAKELESYHLKRGDVVLAMDRPWIEAGLKYSAVTDIDLPALLVQRVSRFRGTNQMDGGYLRYLIGSALFTDYVHTIATGSVVPHISGPNILDFEFDLPPMSLQRDIAAILGALDDKIELNRKTAATLEEMARALYRSWFVDFDPVHARSQGRPPAHMDHPTAALFPDSFGEDGLPEGWELGQVEDLFVLQRGFDLPKSQRRDGPYPVYAAGGFHGNHSEFKVKGPSVTTGRSGVIGQVYLVLEDFWPLNTSLWIKEFKKCSPYFAFFFLQTIDLKSLNSGSAVPSLNRNNVHNMQVGIPPQEIVHKFDDFAAPIFEKIQQLNAENQTLATLRDTLLPRLMSGKLRVGDTRDLVEDIV